MLVEVGLLVQTCLHSAVPAGASRSLGEPRASPGGGDQGGGSTGCSWSLCLSGPHMTKQAQIAGLASSYRSDSKLYFK